MVCPTWPLVALNIRALVWGHALGRGAECLVCIRVRMMLQIYGLHLCYLFVVADSCLLRLLSGVQASHRAA